MYRIMPARTDFTSAWHLESKDHWVFWFCPWRGTYLVQDCKDEWFHPVSQYVRRGDSVRYDVTMKEPG